jgi:hypothetical protein
MAVKPQYDKGKIGQDVLKAVEEIQDEEEN